MLIYVKDSVANESYLIMLQQGTGDNLLDKNIKDRVMSDMWTIMSIGSPVITETITDSIFMIVECIFTHKKSSVI